MAELSRKQTAQPIEQAQPGLPAIPWNRLAAILPLVFVALLLALWMCGCGVPGGG